MGVGIVLAGSVVVINVPGSIERRELLQPFLIVMVQSGFVIIDKYRRSYVHGRAQTKAILDSTLTNQFLDLRGDVYHHNRTGEDNADAHMKRQIMGREVVVAITNGRLDFGPWEQIFYGEFDGRRRKRALVKIIGE